MSKQSQLEIICPDGEIQFHTLDPLKGFTNVGRDPANDIVIDSPQVAPFQAVIDHQRLPFRIMVLADDGDARRGGQRLAPNVEHELSGWDAIEMGGFSLILLEGTAPPQAMPIRPSVDVAPVRPPVRETRLPASAGVSAPAPGEAEAPTALPAPIGLPTRPTDEVDDLILIDLSEREWTIDVEQTAVCRVSIVNGGNIVATFGVRVVGLPDDWVIITPQQVNLNEGGRATVTIAMEPPRQPASRAGRHHVAVEVTSPNYPGRVSRLGATLTINPYYEFIVGDLSPKRQNIGWRRRSGQVILPIANHGNSETTFRLEAEDDERACTFEFELGGDAGHLIRQADLPVSPNQDVAVPVRITPNKRRLVSLRRPSYTFTITTTLAEGGQMPRTVMGQARSLPLIGRWLLLLLVLGFLVLFGFLTSPPPQPSLRMSEQEQAFRQGDFLILHYQALRFPGLSDRNLLNRLNGAFLSLQLEFQPSEGGDWRPATLQEGSQLKKPTGDAIVEFEVNGSYRLLTNSWVSGLISLLGGESTHQRVLVTPVRPEIDRFKATPQAPLSGQPVTLSWNLTNVETARIECLDGQSTSVGGEQLLAGSQVFTFTVDSVCTLYSANSTVPEEAEASVQIRIFVPTPTPIPTGTPIPIPVIVRFDIDPLQVMVGDVVRLSWEVTGADYVFIDPLGQEFPPTGDVGHQPTALTNYKLTAYKVAEDGTQATASASREVFVQPQPTPTTEPVAPEIQIFEAAPDSVVLGENQEVRLIWTVAGTTTNIEITAPELKLSGLKAQDYISVTVKETTLFVLTAYNGELIQSAPIEVEAVEPEPPDPPVIDYFIANKERVNRGENEQVTLYWSVSGLEEEDTSIEIVAPGYRLTGLDPAPPEGRTIYVDDTTTFMLTACNGEECADEVLQITAFDPARITLFIAEQHEDWTLTWKGRNTSDPTHPVDTYEVEAGGSFVLKWASENAEQLTMNGAPLSPEGTVTILQLRQPTRYTLVAMALTGDKRYHSIQMDLVPPPELPPPYSVTGIEDPVQGTNTVKWQYSPLPEHRSRIVAFRIYRANVPPGSPFEPWGQVVVEEGKPFPLSWLDETLGPGQTCGKGYFVVGVYIDPYTGNEAETEVSLNSWFSAACP